jgi:hypothetical protein
MFILHFAICNRVGLGEGLEFRNQEAKAAMNRRTPNDQD